MVEDQTTTGWRACMRRTMSSPYIKITYGGVLFATLFVSANLIWNFATTLMPGMLSFAALAVNYVFISLTSLFSVPFIEAVGMRGALAFATACIALALGMCCIGIDWLLLAISPLLGFAFAVLYNTQSSFCARLGTKTNMGRILGVFWTVANAGSVLSNFLVSTLTKRGITLHTIFLGGLAFTVVPFAMCFFLPAPPLPQHQQHSATEVPDVVTAPSSSKLQTLRRKLVERGKRAVGILRMLKRRDVQLLAPMMVVIGTFAPFYAARINPLLGTEIAGMAWMIQTLLRTVLTFPCGWLSDVVNNALLSVVAWMFFMGMNACVYFFQLNILWVIYAGYVFLSVGDTINWSAVLSPTLSRDFEDVEAIFALYRMSWPIGQVSTLLISPLVSVRAFDIAHSVVFSVAFASLIAYCVLRSRKEKQQAKDVALANKEVTETDESSIDGVALVAMATATPPAAKQDSSISLVQSTTTSTTHSD